MHITALFVLLPFYRPISTQKCLTKNKNEQFLNFSSLDGLSQPIEQWEPEVLDAYGGC